MTTPGDSSNENGNNGNGEYRPNRWSNPGDGSAGSSSAGSSAGSNPNPGAFPSFGAQPQSGDDSYSYGAHAAPSGPGQRVGASQDSFFSALFDFSFTRYATPSIIKFAYALGFAFIALMWVGYVLFALFVPASEFGVGGFFLGLFGIIILTVGMLFMLMSLRMMLEFYLSNIRIAQSAQAIDQRLLERGDRSTGRH